MSDDELKVRMLRAQAANIRGAARVPTNGGHGDSRVLMSVAERLEREADQLETKEAKT